ncbi:MAG: ABC transporter ATP-binding protein [Firmicutes bacterium]|nr:ABC transporter ATP-binding protein [Bacillota bacterium]
MLQVKDVTVGFGGVKALNGLSFEVNQGEIFGVIGPNGAGKTTLLNVVSGIIRPSAGEILYRGRLVSGLPTHTITRLGVGRVFQITQPFHGLTVRENVLVGAYFGTRKSSTSTVDVDAILELVGMDKLASRPVSELSVAMRKRLEFARALALRPDLLLLDEVMAGLAPTEVDYLTGIVKRINREGITIVMVEHVMRAVMATCRRVLVMHLGKHLAVDAPEAVTRDNRVIEVYLGRRYAERMAGTAGEKRG